MPHNATISDQMWEWCKQQGRLKNIGPATFIRDAITALMVKIPKSLTPEEWAEEMIGSPWSMANYEGMHFPSRTNDFLLRLADNDITDKQRDDFLPQVWKYHKIFCRDNNLPVIAIPDELRPFTRENEAEYQVLPRKKNAQAGPKLHAV